MDFKRYIRDLFNVLHLDITKNIEYDRLTKAILKRTLNANSNCIDVGCHKGEILDYFIKYAPNGQHYGFEPIPNLYKSLKEKYATMANILPYAISSKSGESTFKFVRNAPAYSGLSLREYNIPSPDIEEIKVELKTLDEIIPTDIKIDLIKIDVEGGEFDVLKGAKDLLMRDKPTIIFECGLGASEYYGTNPTDIYQYLTNEIGLRVSTLKSFIKNSQSLTQSGFEDLFYRKVEYYFIAHELISE